MFGTNRFNDVEWNDSPVTYTYRSNGQVILIDFCIGVIEEVVPPHLYDPGDCLYSRDAALWHNRLEKVCVCAVQFQKDTGDVLYTDTWNWKWNEGELCDLATAQELLAEYVQPGTDLLPVPGQYIVAPVPEFAIGDVVYVEEAAARGKLRAICVKAVDVSSRPLVTYIDNTNWLWQEAELCTLAEANTLIAAYRGQGISLGGKRKCVSRENRCRGSRRYGRGW